MFSIDKGYNNYFRQENLIPMPRFLDVHSIKDFSKNLQDSLEESFESKI
jgi:hypothetical protein